MVAFFEKISFVTLPELDYGVQHKRCDVYVMFDDDNVQVHSRMRTFKLQKNISIPEE